MTDTPANAPASTALVPLLPAPTPRRIVALTEAGVPLSRAYARIVTALRDAGSEVFPLAVPRQPEAQAEDVPTITELKRGLTSMAKDFVRGLRGQSQATPTEPWLASQLRAVEGKIDAVFALDPEVARAAFPICEKVWPDVLRIGLDADYHLDPTWKAVELDAIVTAHPGLGGDLPRVREGRARLFIGGPVAVHEAGPKKLDEALPQVVVSFSRLDPGDVDPLLFQLSLARPERFSLLFLPSNRPGVDELVRARAGNYGLRGKRPKADADIEPWIAGAEVLIGLPSPAELATAVAAGVPSLLIAQQSALQDGDRFLLQHGAMLSDIPITIAVNLESLLPGGTQRDAAIARLKELEVSGPNGAAQATLAAIKAGRPAVTEATQTTAQPSSQSDELEDIGGPVGPPLSDAPADLPLVLRRAYLKEIILHQHTIEKNLARAKSGLETWQRRVRLARAANDHALADQAVPRVEGLLKVIDQLEKEQREVQALRERFAAPGPLSAADRAAAGRFLSPSTAASLDRGEAPESAFTRLELDDALAALKRKLDGR